jgi:hypothetical protein
MRINDATRRRTGSITGRVAACALLVTLAAAGPVHAEVGDYKWWEVLRNLVKPPAADNRLRPDERTGTFPLVPETVGRSFNPGDYYRWQAVTLAPSTGASCGNGTPFTFFVNVSPTTRNTVLAYEHGGACWDADTCTNPDNPLGASNPDGISRHYFDLVVADPASGEFSLFNRSAANSVLTPFVARLHPERLKTRDWNKVYVPYCTGDVHAGRAVAVYPKPDGSELVWHHTGANNARAVTAWMRENLQRPRQLAQVGCSAGSTGATVNYHHVRKALSPDRSFLLADSGPLFPAPANGDPATHPSVPLHRLIRRTWSLDDGILALYERELAGFSRDDVGGLYRSLSTRWPDDRFGLVAFWRDGVYANYSYRDSVIAAGVRPADRVDFADALMERRAKDMLALKQEIAALGNVGAFMPQYRELMAAHCGTIVDWQHTDIQERRLGLRDFVDDVLDGKGTLMQVSESNPEPDMAREAPLHHQIFNWLAGGLADWWKKGTYLLAGADVRLGRLFDGRTGLPWSRTVTGGSGAGSGASDSEPQSTPCMAGEPQCANGIL